MGKKKNRCAITSCNMVIDDKWVFCYMHRNCKLKSVAQSAPLKNYFCDSCGQVSQARHHTSCKWCGGRTEMTD